MFDNGSEFKLNFTNFLNDFDNKPVLTKIKNPQANDPVEQAHQVILYMLVKKDIDNKVFDYIYQWGETLEYITWEIRDSYHRTIQDTPDQHVFGRDMILNLASFIYW